MAPTASFLDTNIVIYAFSEQDARKREVSRRLISSNERWYISWQVIQEFCNVALHHPKHQIPHDLVATLLEELLAPRCRVQPSTAIWTHALEIQHQTQYRFYDSLIVAAAIESGATILYSEDLQHGRQIGPLQIINPFL